LSKRFYDRIDPDVAAEAYKRYLKGSYVSNEDAVRLLARVLAAWCIEAGEMLGYIKILGWGGG
jgi:hypothetical protein